MLSKQLQIMESFYTIQGEGFHQGKAAYFIRLGGCDVGCHWCDVKESWNVDSFPLIDTKKIAQQAAQFPSRIAIVTGGEPLMHDLSSLCEELKKEKFKLHIETSGAYPLSGTWDWICLSPKKFKLPIDAIYSKAHELKLIIYNKSDFEWAESFQKKVKADCKLYLQPEWGKSKEVLPLIIDYIKKNPAWEISLQIHKFMEIP